MWPPIPVMQETTQAPEEHLQRDQCSHPLTPRALASGSQSSSSPQSSPKHQAERKACVSLAPLIAVSRRSSRDRRRSALSHALRSRAWFETVRRDWDKRRSARGMELARSSDGLGKPAPAHRFSASMHLAGDDPAAPAAKDPAGPLCLPADQGLRLVPCIDHRYRRH